VWHGEQPIDESSGGLTDTLVHEHRVGLLGRVDLESLVVDLVLLTTPNQLGATQRRGWRKDEAGR
jgi:hypothetical protein